MPAGRNGDICTFKDAPNYEDGQLMTLAPRLKAFLEIALDAYEDEHGVPTSDSHFVNQGRRLLAELE